VELRRWLDAGAQLRGRALLVFGSFPSFDLFLGFLIRSIIHNCEEGEMFQMLNSFK
jgi:hypothetical protein